MDLMVLADALLLPGRRSRARHRAEEPAVRLRRRRPVRDRVAAAKARCATRCAHSGEPRFAEAAAMLDRLAACAATRDAVRLLRRACSGPRTAASGSSARLGHEANDALDEFLNLALDYERRETPSLQGFVAWLRTAQTDVKRDMEITRDEVRVMTVHGAKGLEAPIVILADTMTPPAGPPQRQPRLLMLPGTRGAGDRPAFVWAVAKREDAAPVGDARERIAPRGRARIPPPALRGDDARDRPAGRLRRRGRARAARGLLVRSRVRRTGAKPRRGDRRGWRSDVWRYRKVPRSVRATAGRRDRRRRDRKLRRPGSAARRRLEPRAAVPLSLAARL